MERFLFFDVKSANFIWSYDLKWNEKETYFYFTIVQQYINNYSWCFFRGLALWIQINRRQIFEDQRNLPFSCLLSIWFQLLMNRYSNLNVFLNQYQSRLNNWKNYLTKSNAKKKRIEKIYFNHYYYFATSSCGQTAKIIFKCKL